MFNPEEGFDHTESIVSQYKIHSIPGSGALCNGNSVYI